MISINEARKCLEIVKSDIKKASIQLNNLVISPGIAEQAAEMQKNQNMQHDNNR